MLYEVLIKGSPPWGFRISGGIEQNQPTCISRITPGGKAHQSNVKIGDHLLAVNGRRTDDLRLRKVMKLIKTNNDHLHLTLERATEKDDNEERQEWCSVEKIISKSSSSSANVTEFTITEQEHHRKEVITSLPEVQPRQRQPPVPKVRRWKSQTREISDGADHETNFVSELKIPQKPHGTETEINEIDIDDTDEASISSYSGSSYRRVSDAEFQPQVHWLRGKLRLMKENNKNGPSSQNGGAFKTAILNRAGETFEVDGGNIDVTLRHLQYNTPARLYSEDQLMNVVVEKARAERRCDPKVLRKVPIKVDRQSSVYRLVHNISPARSTPQQSPSVHLLEKMHEVEGSSSDGKTSGKQRDEN